MKKSIKAETFTMKKFDCNEFTKKSTFSRITSNKRHKTDIFTSCVLIILNPIFRNTPIPIFIKTRDSFEEKVK